MKALQYVVVMGLTDIHLLWGTADHGEVPGPVSNHLRPSQKILM